ncbi:hypothetical protein PT974_10036 [Cladobotryum mycophilum]|uniref:F-box domain-containing protein n=1 Tax=Cladobotryum mycophilum TaxID=491253 RepID=A0ABR0S8Q6_9HYPO
MELAVKLRRLISRLPNLLTHKSQTSPQHIPECHILKLPVELILLIASNLSLESQIILSMTCRAFRDILYDARQQARTLPDRQKLNILAAIAYDYPHQWACYRCWKLHPMSKDDLPDRPRPCACPRWKSQSTNAFGRYSFQLSHRHVQMTFKLMRFAQTERKYAAQLRNLLKACHYTDFPHQPLGESVLFTKLSVYPRLADGRYMLHCRWKYEWCIENVSCETLGILWVCRHQWFISDDQAEFRAEPNNRDNFFAGPNAINRATKTAFAIPGVEIRGACHRCATDFSIKASHKCTIVQTWHDFGLEGTELDINWRTLRVDDGHDSWCRTLYHEPGSVCALYSNQR